MILRCRVGVGNSTDCNSPVPVDKVVATLSIYEGHGQKLMFAKTVFQCGRPGSTEKENN